MGLKNPYKRTCRPFIDGKYGGGPQNYILHKDFADSPEHYIRAFLLIQKDLQNLFDYIEPADQNLDCYSYRIQEMLIRTCVEVEANCKAILIENGYSKKGDLNIIDYRKINVSHKLSSYEVALPLWNGNQKIRRPFRCWKDDEPLSWYRAYNAIKHDRHNEFNRASFDNLIDSVCGLVVILSAQFLQEDFIPSPVYLTALGSRDGMESAIGEYFRVKFPNDWSEEEQYDFTHEDINNPDFQIEKFDYDNI